MLKNSDGNIMVLTDFNVNPNDVFVMFMVYPNATAQKNGLSAFQRAINLNASLGNDFRKKLAAAKAASTTSLVEDIITGLIEDEVVSQASADVKKFTNNGQIKGDWVKA